MIWKNLVKITQKNGVLKRKIHKRELLNTKDFNVAVVSLEKEEEIPPHPENYAVFFYVLQGIGVFTTKEGEYTLKKGSCIYYEKNGLRGIRSKERLVLLGIQEPH